MPPLRVHITHDPKDKHLPYTATLWNGETEMNIRGYGATADEATADARSKYEAEGTAERPYWRDLYDS